MRSPRLFGFEGQQDLRAGTPQDRVGGGGGGNRHITPGGCIQVFMFKGTQGKSMTAQEHGQIYLPSCRVSWGGVLWAQRQW